MGYKRYMQSNARAARCTYLWAFGERSTTFLDNVGLRCDGLINMRQAGVEADFSRETK